MSQEYKIDEIEDDSEAAEQILKLKEFHENGEHYDGDLREKHTATDRFHRTALAVRRYIGIRESDSRKITVKLFHAYLDYFETVEGDIDRIRYLPDPETDTVGDDWSPYAVEIDVPVDNIRDMLSVADRFSYRVSGTESIGGGMARITIGRGRSIKDVPDWIDYDRSAEGSA